MTEDKIGIVVNYYAKPGVVAIHVQQGNIQIGDFLKYKGHTTDFTEEVVSIEIENQPIQEAKAGDLIGVKVSQKVREKDKVYKVVEPS